MSVDILLKNVCGYFSQLTELLCGKQIHDMYMFQFSTDLSVYLLGWFGLCGAAARSS